MSRVFVSGREVAGPAAVPLKLAAVLVIVAAMLVIGAVGLVDRMLDPVRWVWVRFRKGAK